MSKKKKTKIKFLILAVFLLIFIGMSLFLNGVVYPVITGYAEAKVNSMTITAVNNAIFTVLSDELVYSDLVTVQKDNNGKISMIEANTVKINNIAKNTAKQSKTELDKIGEQTLKIPIGSLLNSPLLIGLGPEVSVKILTAGSVYCNFKSVFDTAGINQTRHRIYIEVNAETEIVLPSSSRQITSKTEIFIAEAILLGDVPHTFLNFGLGLIDFIPKK